MTTLAARLAKSARMAPRLPCKLGRRTAAALLAAARESSRAPNSGGLIRDVCGAAETVVVRRCVAAGC